MTSGEDLQERWDVAVIGAGPAGLAAASLAARAGLTTVLLDEQPGAGGQVYRAASTSPLRGSPFFAEEFERGSRLITALASSGAHFVSSATVWSLDAQREIGVLAGGSARLIRAKRVILATGAMERPFPVRGWTLPGVMGAGAAQALLKSAGLVPEGPIVLAGTGPLLWLVAAQLLDAGGTVSAVLDTTSSAHRLGALAHAPGFVLSPYFRRGLALTRKVRRSVRVVTGVVALAAEGEARLEAVTYRTAAGAEERLPVSLLLLHLGVVPNVNLAMAAGVAHRWDEAQACFAPVLDVNFETSIRGISIAGDGGGIAGAEAAEAQGQIVAIAVLRALRPNSADAFRGEEVEARRALMRWRRGRRFLETRFAPPRSLRVPEGETIVCRCEEVRAHEIAAAVEEGCTGPNQVKAFLRCGMGPCQGRMCGLAVTEIIAAARNTTPGAVGYFRLRPPVKPVPLGALAALPKSEAGLRAVIRD